MQRELHKGKAVAAPTKSNVVISPQQLAETLNQVLQFNKMCKLIADCAFRLPIR